MARIKNQHTYSLKNCQGGTAVDLSGDDNYSVQGYCPHDGSNQAWIFQQDGDQNGWFIKSSHSGQYLGIEGNASGGTRVVAVPSPFKWDVKDSDVKSAKGIRILAYGTNFSLDLDYGKSANQTKIILWGSWSGANQIWAPTERASIEDQHTYSLRYRQGGTEDQDADSKACFHPRLV
ncbi:ricin B lectin domain-containing protein [Suillus subaureus]|uniref:Ricin B lectin domain-containing protein n=1 Tax=Suillus subaureus TaxID=48587 RepID=A0A9P7E4Y3_9AGAM|nr:ricin B lectin domain-containing protein [Suillus subaureus]KAG1810882.1 ricin B lectin domain-containing protein [Suillus subaureus]